MPSLSLGDAQKWTSQSPLFSLTLPLLLFSASSYHSLSADTQTVVAVSHPTAFACTADTKVVSSETLSGTLPAVSDVLEQRWLTAVFLHQSPATAMGMLLSAHCCLLSL